MDDIQIMPKPEWVSWEEIHEVIYVAHKVNRERGLFYKTATMTGEQLEKRLKGGMCFVALKGKKVVGTKSVKTYLGKNWYNKGQNVAHMMLSGILPEYQGEGVYEDLTAAANKYVKKIGVRMLQGGTAGKNVLVRKLAEKQGYVTVDYETQVGVNYYSVIFVKWLDGNPFPMWYCKFRLALSKAWVRFRYKPGKIERFKLVGFAVKVYAKLKQILRLH